MGGVRKLGVVDLILGVIYDKGIYKGSIKGLGFRVSRKLGV